jgi:hypothetical protein
MANLQKPTISYRGYYKRHLVITHNQNSALLQNILLYSGISMPQALLTSEGDCDIHITYSSLGEYIL